MVSWLWKKLQVAYYNWIFAFKLEGYSFNINADYRDFSAQLSKRTAKYEQVTKKNDEKYFLTKN